MLTVEEVREFMYKDIYAVETTGVTIEEVDAEGRVHVRMEVDDRHANGIGRVMGGALFTLADFAFASTVYANEILSTAINGSMEFLSAGKGPYLTAVGYLDKSGRKILFGGADVFDDSGKLIARLTAQSYRLE